MRCSFCFSDFPHKKKKSVLPHVMQPHCVVVQWIWLILNCEYITSYSVLHFTEKIVSTCCTGDRRNVVPRAPWKIDKKYRNLIFFIAWSDRDWVFIAYEIILSIMCLLNLSTFMSFRPVCLSKFLCSPKAWKMGILLIFILYMKFSILRK